MQKLLHLIAPRKSNNYKARLLHIQGLLAVFLLILAAQAVIQVSVSPSVNILGYAANISPSEVVRLTNEKRTSVGSGELQHSDTLSRAAKLKGEHMLAQDYWAHISPSGVEPWQFFKDVGYTYRYAGENLARDFSNPQSTVDAWMASPTHKENMLSDKYSEIGVAVVEGDLGGVEATIVVQLFGTRLDTIPVVPVASAEDLATDELPSLSPSLSTELGEKSDGVNLVSSDAVSPVASSPFSITRSLSLGIILVLMFVMVIDAAIVAKKNVTRKSGRAFAHLSFFAMLIAIIIIARAGEIL